MILDVKVLLALRWVDIYQSLYSNCRLILIYEFTYHFSLNVWPIIEILRNVQNIVNLWWRKTDIQMVKIKGDCTFNWKWCNWWPWLFKLSFHNTKGVCMTLRALLIIKFWQKLSRRYTAQAFTTSFIWHYWISLQLTYLPNKLMLYLILII